MCFKDVYEIFGVCFSKTNTMSFFFQVKYEMLNFQICQRQCSIWNVDQMKSIIFSLTSKQSRELCILIYVQSRGMQNSP